MNISFIGFGNMAKAIAKGLLIHNNHCIFAAAPSLTSGITDEGIQTFNNNLAVLPNADVVVLAVKPKQTADVLAEIHSSLLPKTLIISVAAGISLNWYAKLYPQLAVVRAMPNVGATVGESATPLIANSMVTALQKEQAETIFNAVGLTAWVHEEHLMDAFTALSGSGPAYVYLFLEAMINAAQSLGIESNKARQFALQTVYGAFKTAQASKLNLSDLRKKVTSPGGTTAAALKVFEEQQLNETVLAAMKAAVNRAQELDND